MTLRPEGSAPVVRAYLQRGLASEGAVCKLYYVMTMYRYEHGQRGRYREHQQTGVEHLGAAHPSADAEVISLAMEFYRQLGLAGAELRLNSIGCAECRPAYREALLEYARPRLDAMSADNRARFHTNPLRMLDSKDPADRQALAGSPRLTDFLCETCARHFADVGSFLETLGIPYQLDPYLVRGFDYYNRTTFEIVHPELGAQNVIGGGGRYDGLAEQLGGPPTPGVGFGIGTERCLIVLEQLGVELPLDQEIPEVYVAAQSDAQRMAAFALTHRLRRAGLRVEVDTAGRSLKAQMKAADRAGVEWVVLIGEEELAAGEATLKPMRREGEARRVALEDVLAEVRGCAV
jgi:histidyl-tRNA synthetase